MKLSLANHGGLAAAIRRPARSLEVSRLAAADAAELGRLLAAAHEAPGFSSEGPGSARDAMSYTITVEEDDGRQTTLRGSDVNMSPAFEALLRWVQRHLAAN
jgi:hypothetical protein